MLDSGAEPVILGCTEIPLAFRHIPTELQPCIVDATYLLAAHAVEWCLNPSAGQAA